MFSICMITVPYPTINCITYSSFHLPDCCVQLLGTLCTLCNSNLKLYNSHLSLYHSHLSLYHSHFVVNTFYCYQFGYIITALFWNVKLFFHTDCSLLYFTLTFFPIYPKIKNNNKLISSYEHAPPMVKSLKPNTID